MHACNVWLNNVLKYHETPCRETSLRRRPLTPWLAMWNAIFKDLPSLETPAITCMSFHTSSFHWTRAQHKGNIRWIRTQYTNDKQWNFFVCLLELITTCSLSKSAMEDPTRYIEGKRNRKLKRKLFGNPCARDGFHILHCFDFPTFKISKQQLIFAHFLLYAFVICYWFDVGPSLTF